MLSVIPFYEDLGIAKGAALSLGLLGLAALAGHYSGGDIMSVTSPENSDGLQKNYLQSTTSNPHTFHQVIITNNQSR